MAFSPSQLTPVAMTRGVGGFKHRYKYWDNFSQGQVETLILQTRIPEFLRTSSLNFPSFEVIFPSICVTTNTIISHAQSPLTKLNRKCSLMRAAEVFAVNNAVNGRWLDLASVKIVSTQISLESPVFQGKKFEN